MKNSATNVLSVNEVPYEANTVLYESVELNRRWCFFEGYENVTYNQTIDWKTLVKQVFSFDDIITFWQFWNNSIYSKFSEIYNNGERIR